MRCKAIDQCSRCDCEIYYIDEEQDWVQYIPNGLDQFGNQKYETVCSDCCETDLSDLRKRDNEVREWLYDKLSTVN